MATEKNDKFDVILEKVGDQPLKTTRILCQVLGLGLAAAKAVVDKAPTTIAKMMEKDKAIALRNELENVGNVVSIPGIKIETVDPEEAQKNTEVKKTTEKSAPSPLTASPLSNDGFDAIFGGRTVKKTPAPARSKDSVKTAPKAKVDNVSAAPNDEFDAIFGKDK